MNANTKFNKMGAFIIISVLLIGDHVHSFNNVRSSSPSSWALHTRIQYQSTKNQKDHFRKPESILIDKHTQTISNVQSKDQIMLPSDSHDNVYLSVVPPPDSMISSHVNQTNSENRKTENHHNDKQTQPESVGNSSLVIVGKNQTKFEKDMDMYITKIYNKYNGQNFSTSTTRSESVTITAITKEPSNNTPTVEANDVNSKNINQTSQLVDYNLDTMKAPNFMHQVAEQIMEHSIESIDSFDSGSNETYDLPVPSALRGGIDDFVEEHRNPLIAQVVDPSFVESKHSTEGFYQADVSESIHKHIMSRPKRRRHHQFIRNRLNGLAIFPENKRVRSKGKPFLQLPINPKLINWKRGPRPRPGSKYFKAMKERANYEDYEPKGQRRMDMNGRRYPKLRPKLRLPGARIRNHDGHMRRKNPPDINKRPNYLKSDVNEPNIIPIITYDDTTEDTIEKHDHLSDSYDYNFDDEAVETEKPLPEEEAIFISEQNDFDPRPPTFSPIPLESESKESPEEESPVNQKNLLKNLSHKKTYDTDTNNNQIEKVRRKNNRYWSHVDGKGWVSLEDDEEKFSKWKAVKDKKDKFPRPYENEKNDQTEWNEINGSSPSKEGSEFNDKREAKKRIKTKFWNDETSSGFFGESITDKNVLANGLLESPRYNTDYRKDQRKKGEKDVINYNSFSRPEVENARYEHPSSRENNEDDQWHRMDMPNFFSSSGTKENKQLFDDGNDDQRETTPPVNVDEGRQNSYRRRPILISDFINKPKSMKEFKDTTYTYNRNANDIKTESKISYRKPVISLDDFNHPRPNIRSPVKDSDYKSFSDIISHDIRSHPIDHSKIELESNTPREPFKRPNEVEVIADNLLKPEKDERLKMYKNELITQKDDVSDSLGNVWISNPIDVEKDWGGNFISTYFDQSEETDTNFAMKKMDYGPIKDEKSAPKFIREKYSFPNPRFDEYEEDVEKTTEDPFESFVHRNSHDFNLFNGKEGIGFQSGWFENPFGEFEAEHDAEERSSKSEVDGKDISRQRNGFANSEIYVPSQRREDNTKEIPSDDKFSINFSKYFSQGKSKIEIKENPSVDELSSNSRMYYPREKTKRKRSRRKYLVRRRPTRKQRVNKEETQPGIDNVELNANDINMNNNEKLSKEQGNSFDSLFNFKRDEEYERATPFPNFPSPTYYNSEAIKNKNDKEDSGEDTTAFRVLPSVATFNTASEIEPHDRYKKEKRNNRAKVKEKENMSNNNNWPEEKSASRQDFQGSPYRIFPSSENFDATDDGGNEEIENDPDFIKEAENILSVVEKVEEKVLDRIEATFVSPINEGASKNENIEEFSNQFDRDGSGWTNQIPTPRPDLNDSELLDNENARNKLREKSNYNKFDYSYQKPQRDVVIGTNYTNPKAITTDDEINWMDDIKTNHQHFPPEPNWSPETSWKNRQIKKEKSKENALDTLKAFVNGGKGNSGYNHPTNGNKIKRMDNDIEYQPSGMNQFQMNARREIEEAQQINKKRKRRPYIQRNIDYHDNTRDPNNIDYSDFYGTGANEESGNQRFLAFDKVQDYQPDYDYEERYRVFREPYQLQRPNEHFRAFSESVETFVDEPIQPFTDSSIQSLINSITQEVDWSRPLKLFPKLNN